MPFLASLRRCVGSMDYHLLLERIFKKVYVAVGLASLAIYDQIIHTPEEVRIRSSHCKAPGIGPKVIENRIKAPAGVNDAIVEVFLEDGGIGSRHGGVILTNAHLQAAHVIT